MATPQPKPTVERSQHYYHVRYRPPEAFAAIRTPDWASHAADSVVPGAEVRTGRRHDRDDWATQSVLLPTARIPDAATARAAADEIVRKIGE